MEKVQRDFIVGSEWLYYKLYMGPRVANIFLTSTLSPLLHEFYEKNYIDNWFFIRYSDSGLHLRVRFHVTNPEALSHIIQCLHRTLQPYLNDRLISNVQLATYKRELERYDAASIEEAEKLFGLNSEFILGLLEHLKDDENQQWLWGVKFIDQFLTDWGYDLSMKQALLKRLKIAFSNEFGANKQVIKQLSVKFRTYRAAIFNILEQNDNELLNQLLINHQVKSAPYIQQILEKKQTGIHTLVIDELLESYLHMHCNRLFRSKQRLNEWILYDLLFKHYDSKLAREKNLKSSRVTV